MEYMSAAAESRGSSVLSPFGDIPVVPWFLASSAFAIGKRRPRAMSSWTDRSSETETVTLCTFQSPEAYEMLRKEGVLIGDPTRGWEEFQEAYAWLDRNMDDRGIPGPAGALLWLWPDPSARRIRTHARQARGEVMLTVRLPAEKVLISEFDDWHAVLNRVLNVPQRVGEAEEDWDRRSARQWDDFSAKAGSLARGPTDELPTDLRAELENSWQQIFDPSTWHPDSTLQATARELRRAEIVRAVRIL